MSAPYGHKPQARKDRELLRHLHRRLGQGSPAPTPTDGEGYGRWHDRMMRDLQDCRQEEAEAWRREYGPWTADEIREWFRSGADASGTPGAMPTGIGAVPGPSGSVPMQEAMHMAANALAGTSPGAPAAPLSASMASTPSVVGGCGSAHLTTKAPSPAVAGHPTMPAGFSSMASPCTGVPLNAAPPPVVSPHPCVPAGNASMTTHPTGAPMTTTSSPVLSAHPGGPAGYAAPIAAPMTMATSPMVSMPGGCASMGSTPTHTPMTTGTPAGGYTMPAVPAPGR